MYQVMQRFIVALTLLVALSACDFDDTFFLTDEQDPVTAPRIGEEFSFTSHREEVLASVFGWLTGSA